MSVSEAEVRDAFSVFADDYDIVGHEGTPFVDLGASPNPLQGGERQYSVSQWPKGASLEEVLAAIAGTDIFVSCMDKDAVGPGFQLLKGQERKVTVLSVAGGITQVAKERQEALRAILAALSQAEDVGVWTTNHDNNCGYLEHKLGRPFSEALGVEPGSQEEAQAMKALILQGVQDTGLEGLLFKRVTPALVMIDRKNTGRGARIGFDGNFTGIEPLSLDEILNF